MGTSIAAVKAALVRARANVAAAGAPGAARTGVADLERLRTTVCELLYASTMAA